MESLSGFSLPTYLAAGALSVLLLYTLFSGPKRQLPPGPKPLPLIGNAHQMPLSHPWLKFAEWKKKYGDLIHLNVVGQSMIVINSRKIAEDLLDKRSLIYSDRPRLVMAGEIVGFGNTFVLQNLGETWRKQRKLVASDFGQSTVPQYHKLQENEARLLVRHVMEDSESLFSQIKLRIGRIIIRVTYGYSVKDLQDPMIHIPLVSLGNFSAGATPGNFLVDFIPAMRHLPKWMPGAGFLTTAEKWSKIFWDSCYDPVDWVRDNLPTGKVELPNICASHITKIEGEFGGDARYDLALAAGSVLGAGLDTNMTSALTFLMQMVYNPDVMRKAQAEIDRVIGKDRLPDIADRAQLPYVASVMAESLRVAPAIPLCVPHSLKEDDVYEGMFLPKGSVMLPNIWFMLHDPDVYPEPEKFNPDRYNNDEAEMAKVSDLVFGFGRRVCPGMHFAHGTLFAIIATTLATCDILPALDENGKEDIPSGKYVTGTIIFPEHFRIRLRPRSPQAVSLLSEASTGED